MTKQRRYDLDWLRVISVFAVFLHHVLMPFNGDEFHIMNSESSKLLDDTMVYFEQFRLPLLFFVSGVGTVFAFSKRSSKDFVIERAKRLLIPLVFGVFVLIPPQGYFENIKDFTSFFSAYPTIIEKLEANHLWFIENLFFISILFIPIILFFRSDKSEGIKSFIQKYSNKYGLLSWLIVFIFIRVVSKDFYPSNSKSLLNLSSTLYFSFFFMSGIIIETNNLWYIVSKNRKRNLIFVIIFTVLFYVYYFVPNEWMEPHLSIKNRWRLWYLVCSLVSWSVIIAVLGYAQKLLNKKSSVLVKLNEAVYPFYMLHQTVIIMVGYYIIQFDIGIASKILSLLFSSFVIIVLIYKFLVCPFKIVRFLFGMKMKS